MWYQLWYWNPRDVTIGVFVVFWTLAFLLMWMVDKRRK